LEFLLNNGWGDVVDLTLFVNSHGRGLCWGYLGYMESIADSVCRHNRATIIT